MNKITQYCTQLLPQLEKFSKKIVIEGIPPRINDGYDGYDDFGLEAFFIHDGLGWNFSSRLSYRGRSLSCDASELRQLRQLLSRRTDSEDYEQIGDTRFWWRHSNSVLEIRFGPAYHEWDRKTMTLDAKPYLMLIRWLDYWLAE